MQRQPTLGNPLLQLLPQALRLHLRPTMANRIVGIAFEVAALRERIARDGLHLSDELQFIKG